MLDRIHRESPGERRFLDGAAHGRQSDWHVPVAVSLAGPLVGGLFLQCGAVIRLAAVELGGRQGAHRAGGLPGRGAPAGRPLAPRGEAAALLPGFLFRRALAHFEPDRFSSGASWPSGFSICLRWAWPAAWWRPSARSGHGKSRASARLRAAWTALGSCLALPREPTPATSTGRMNCSLWTSAVDVCPESATAALQSGPGLERIPGRLPDADCRDTRQRCGSTPITRRRTTIWRTPWRNCRPAAGGDCRIPGGAADSARSRRGALQPGKRPGATARPAAGGHCRISKRRCDLSPMTRKRTTTWERPGQCRGPLPEAIAEYQAALRVDPDLPRRTTTWQTPCRSCPAGCRTRSPSIKRRCASSPITRKRTSTWETPWRNCPAGCRTRLPSMKRPCGSIPITPRRTINLGNALSQLPGRLPDAIAQYEAAVRIEPGNPTAHNNLGLALVNSGGRLPEAIAHYEAAAADRSRSRRGAFQPGKRPVATAWPAAGRHRSV